MYPHTHPAPHFPGLNPLPSPNVSLLLHDDFPNPEIVGFLYRPQQNQFRDFCSYDRTVPPTDIGKRPATTSRSVCPDLRVARCVLVPRPTTPQVNAPRRAKSPTRVPSLGFFNSLFYSLRLPACPRSLSDSSPRSLFVSSLFELTGGARFAP